MYTNPFVIQLLAEERMKDAMRRNEQTRLIREAEGFRTSRRWRLPMIFTSESFLLSFHGRSVNNLKSMG